MMASIAAYPQLGNLRQYLSLFLPLLFLGFLTALFGLIEKVLLARLSIKDVEAAVTVAYACQIFQITSLAFAMMAQVTVARWVGEKNWKAIGPSIWQFIWFSLFSGIIVVPLGTIYGIFFLEQIPIKEIALPYFHFFLWINFLFPLGAVLSCFYLGQGKTRLVLLATTACQLLKISFAIPLILGWGRVPSFGLLGGAISTLIAQGTFCIFLFALFIRARNHEIYHSRMWQLKIRLFWECIQPGLLRAANRVLTLTSWAGIVFLMGMKGEAYLLALSIGGGVFLFLYFIGDAICQTGTIIASQMIGSRKYDLLGKVSFLGFFLGMILIAIAAIPFVLCPNFTFEYLFPNVKLNAGSVQQILFGIWISFIFYIFSCIKISYILAFKDMYFSVFIGAFNWVNGFFLMYIALEQVAIRADLFWLVLSLMHISTTIIYFFRARKLCAVAYLSQYAVNESIEKAGKSKLAQGNIQ